MCETHPLHPGEGPPLFIAAGVLKTPGDVEPFLNMDPRVVPVLTLGGFTLPAWGGIAKHSERDFVHYPELGIAGNAISLRNPGIEGIYELRDTIAQLNERGIKSIIQINTLPHENYEEVIPPLATAAVEVGPTAIEVNLGCPHGLDRFGNFERPIGTNPDASGRLLQLVRDEVGDDIVVGAKDLPHVSSLDDEVNEQEIDTLSDVITPLINYLVGINTIGGQSFPEFTFSNGIGGMSGPAVAEIAKQHLAAWKHYEPDLAYLSCGGIERSNLETELHERRALGALLVGGAQEYYRAKNVANLATAWAIKAMYAQR